MSINETNKKYIIGAIVLVLAVGGVIVLKNSKDGDKAVPKKIKGGDTAAVSPSPSPTLEATTKEQIYQGYLQEGQKYRTLAFQGDASAFYKAIDVYKKAAEISDNKVWVPYMNLGTTYQAMKDYNSAEEAYNKAISISPEGMFYIKKADLYRYDMKKSDTEIIAVYEEALKKVGVADDVMISYASYLSDTGKYQDALKYYKILASKYPSNQSYKDEIASLKAKIK